MVLGSTLCSHSEHFKFDPWSDMAADSVHSSKPLPFLKLRFCEYGEYSNRNLSKEMTRAFGKNA